MCIVCVCVCNIKFHINAQSDPVILVILCHSHSSSQGGINDTYYEKCVGGCVRVRVCVWGGGGVWVCAQAGASGAIRSPGLRETVVQDIPGNNAYGNGERSGKNGERG